MKIKCLVAIALLSVSGPGMAKSTQDGIAYWENGDYNRAINVWYRKAKRGDSEALFYLGRAYRYGDHVPQNTNLAMEYLRRSAELNNQAGISEYGLYLYSQGLYAQSMYYIQRASEYDTRATYVFGLSLWNGQGITQNKAQALDVMKEAAVTGFEPAVRAYTEMTAPKPVAPVKKTIRKRKTRG
jgi:TPR repeat protein